MIRLLLALSLSLSLVSCRGNFPVDYVYAMITNPETGERYCYGIKIDGSGERQRVPIDKCWDMRMRCVTPEYYGNIMYWAGRKP